MGAWLSPITQSTNLSSSTLLWPLSSTHTSALANNPLLICYNDLPTSPQVPTRLKASGSHAVVLEGGPRSMSHWHLYERTCLQQSQASHPRKVVIDLWGISISIRMSLHVPRKHLSHSGPGAASRGLGTVESFLPCNMWLYPQHTVTQSWNCLTSISINLTMRRGVAYAPRTLQSGSGWKHTNIPSVHLSFLPPGSIFGPW